jgi:hypothetical protein
MESVHYYFDESGEKGFVQEGFNRTNIGLIAGIALPSMYLPEFEETVSDILSKLNTSNSNKTHSTELFDDKENRKVRDELLEYLSKSDGWLLVYEAVYPLGLYQNEKSTADIFNAHKPNNPRVKLSKNSKKCRIYNYLLKGVIIKLDEMCHIEKSTNLVMVSDHIDSGIQKEALEALSYLKEKEHRKTVTGLDTITNKIVSKDILSKVEGMDISVKNVKTIEFDSSESPMTIAADIIVNTLYRHINQKINIHENLRLHSKKALEGYVLQSKVAFVDDNYVMDSLHAPQ